MKGINSATDLYLAYQVDEFIETLPVGLPLRQWMLFNLAALLNFLNWWVNDVKVLPDWVFLAYMGIVFINRIKFSETGEKL